MMTAIHAGSSGPTLILTGEAVPSPPDIASFADVLDAAATTDGLVVMQDVATGAPDAESREQDTHASGHLPDTWDTRARQAPQVSWLLTALHAGPGWNAHADVAGEAELAPDVAHGDAPAGSWGPVEPHTAPTPHASVDLEGTSPVPTRPPADPPTGQRDVVLLDGDRGMPEETSDAPPSVEPTALSSVETAEVMIRDAPERRAASPDAQVETSARGPDPGRLVDTREAVQVEVARVGAAPAPATDHVPDGEVLRAFAEGHTPAPPPESAAGAGPLGSGRAPQIVHAPEERRQPPAERTADVPTLPVPAPPVPRTDAGTDRDADAPLSLAPPFVGHEGPSPSPGVDLTRLIERLPAAPAREQAPMIDVRATAGVPVAAASAGEGAAAVWEGRPALPGADPAAVMDQIVRSLHVHARNGIGEARIQLRPEHLGAVNILLKVEGGAVTAVVRADSPQVQEWILSHQHSLRQQLEAAGLRLEDLTVSPDDDRRREQGEPPPERRPRRRSRHGDGAERLFDLFA